MEKNYIQPKTEELKLCVEHSFLLSFSQVDNDGMVQQTSALSMKETQMVVLALSLVGLESLMTRMILGDGEIFTSESCIH